MSNYTVNYTAAHFMNATLKARVKNIADKDVVYAYVPVTSNTGNFGTAVCRSVVKVLRNAQETHMPVLPDAVAMAANEHIISVTEEEGQYVGVIRIRMNKIVDAVTLPVAEPKPAKAQPVAVPLSEVIVKEKKARATKAATTPAVVEPVAEPVAEPVVEAPVIKDDTSKRAPRAHKVPVVVEEAATKEDPVLRAEKRHAKLVKREIGKHIFGEFQTHNADHFKKMLPVIANGYACQLSARYNAHVTLTTKEVTVIELPKTAARTTAGLALVRVTFRVRVSLYPLN